MQLSENLLIGASLSLSSTAVVIKCLGTETESLHRQLLVGALVIQDCLLSLLLALLPALHKSTSFSHALSSLAVTALYMLVFVGLSFLVTRYLLKILLLKSDSLELRMLCIFAICFGHLIVSERMGLSSELGM